MSKKKFWALFTIIAFITIIYVFLTIHFDKLTFFYFSIGIFALFYFWISKEAFKFLNHFYVNVAFILCTVSLGFISIFSAILVVRYFSIVYLVLYIVLIIMFGISIGVGFVKPIGNSKNLSIAQCTIQTVLYIIFFCISIPIFVANTVEGMEWLSTGIIIANSILAAIIAVVVQVYKNVFNNAVGMVWFGNFLQDGATIIVLLASLEIADFQYSIYWLLVPGLFAYVIRSYLEKKPFKR